MFFILASTSWLAARADWLWWNFRMKQWFSPRPALPTVGPGARSCLHPAHLESLSSCPLLYSLCYELL